MNDTIIIPQDFKRPRFVDGAWYNKHVHWSDEDLMLLTAAADLSISPNAAANTLGRPPTTLVDKALREGIWVPREWRKLLYKPAKRVERLNLEYPYIVKPDDRHADLIAVNRLVSKELPGREDVCQDVMLALWESRTSLAELRSDPRAIRSFVKAFRKASFERSGFNVESMDVTLHSDEGDGKSKYEDERYQRTLADADDEYLEDAYGKRILGRGTHGRDFANGLIEHLSREEEELGVPACMWMRAELTSTN